MKTLIVYYSKNGTTRKLAEEIREKTGSDIEELVSLKKYSGITGFIIAGKEGLQRIPGDIKPTNANVSDYDLVVIGTPVWGGNVSSPTRRYLMGNSGKIKKVAFFCTMGGDNSARTFDDMQEACGLKPVATLAVPAKELIKGKHKDKTEEFISVLK